MIKGVGSVQPDSTGGYRKPSVSVVIPTLNEAKNLPLVLPYIPMDIVDEVILVDGRSTDRTIDVARRLLPSIRVILEKKPGKGAALRRGYKESTGDIIVVIDADGSHDPREIPRFVTALMEGADFVKGSRFATQGGTTDMPRLRKFGNWGFVKMVNLLFAQTFTDLCYGFHAFWRYSLDYLELERVDGFEVDTAIYLQAVRSKLKVVDVPSFEGFRFYGVGKLQTFPDGWRVLRTIVREWIAALRQPAEEPQIGFRGYTRRPVLPMDGFIPVSGAANAITNGHSHTAPYSPPTGYALQRITIDEFFREMLTQISSPDAQPILEDMLLAIFEGLGASSGSLVVFDDQMRVVDGYLVYGRNIEPASINTIEDTLEQGLAGWAIRHRQPVLIHSTSSDPRWLRRDWEEYEEASRSAVVVPFISDEKVVGVLTLTRPDDRRFTERDLLRLKEMAISV